MYTIHGVRVWGLKTLLGLSMLKPCCWIAHRLPVIVSDCERCYDLFFRFTAQLLFLDDESVVAVVVLVAATRHCGVLGKREPKVEIECGSAAQSTLLRGPERLHHSTTQTHHAKLLAIGSLVRRGEVAFLEVSTYIVCVGVSSSQNVNDSLLRPSLHPTYKFHQIAQTKPQHACNPPKYRQWHHQR